MRRIYLIMVLQAPLVAYGDEAVDSKRPTDLMPGKSMLTGLFGNALGYRRQNASELTSLQRRIHYGARTEQFNPAGTLRDFHTAQLGADDEAWTTYGVPERRAGSVRTYQSPEIREVNYLTDHRTLLAVALDDPEHSPTLDDLSAALVMPARPLFIGRKCCLPERPIFEQTVEADNSTEALYLVDAPAGVMEAPVQWEGTERHVSVRQTEEVWMSDLKDWSNGVHTGRRMVYRGIQRPRGQSADCLGE